MDPNLVGLVALQEEENTLSLHRHPPWKGQVRTQGGSCVQAEKRAPHHSLPCWPLTLDFPTYGFVRNKCLFYSPPSLWYLLWLPELANTPCMRKSVNIHSTREDSTYLERGNLFTQLSWGSNNTGEMQFLNFLFLFLYSRLVWPLAITGSQIALNHRVYEEAVMIIQRIYFSTPGSIYLITL